MIDPVAFTIIGFPIRWYGLAYLMTFLIGVPLAKYCTNFLNEQHGKLTHNDIDKLLNYVVCGVIIGGRVGEFAFYRETIFTKEIFQIWQGGMSFHGGLIGVSIAMIMFAVIHKKSLLQIADIVALCAPIGCFLGRIANYINQEVIGKDVLMPWMHKYFTKHPVVFYEALLEGIVLFAIIFRPKNLNDPGKTSMSLLFFYGVFRFCTEFFRVPEKEIGLLTIGQVLSIIMILASGLLFLYRKAVAKRIY